MGKSGKNKRGGRKSGFVNGSDLVGLTLKQQIDGRGGNQKKKISSSSNSSSNVGRSILKTKHLEKLALWAGGHVSIPSFGALFGQRLGSCYESMGTPIDSSLFLCQRCKSILQPGSTCTVRIVKNGSKKRKRRKNEVFLHKTRLNLKRGTSKNHMKEILLARLKQVESDEKQLNLVKTKADKGKVDMNVEAIVCPGNVAGFKGNVVDQICSRSVKAIGSNIKKSEAKVAEMDYVVCKDVASENNLATPLNRAPMLFLDAKRRKRNRSNDKQVSTISNSKPGNVEKVSGSLTKRRKKSWSTLKELAEANVQKNDIANLIIPFRF
ncbi:hypothetical protein MKW92_043165 [Papaver armeniacum]|nr:hypothetical protein MKW92_043165 [Papaver armeniacum]